MIALADTARGNPDTLVVVSAYVRVTSSKGNDAIDPTHARLLSELAKAEGG